MERSEESLTVLSPAGDTLRAVIHRPAPARRSDHCVILCHGMLSSKDGTKQIALSAALETLGVACLRFDFSGCGESEGRIEDMTISRRIGDLTAVAEEAQRRGFPFISLVGSSLGAAVSVLAAGRGVIPTPICIVLFAAVSRPARILEGFPRDQVARWKASGRFQLEGVSIRWGFFDDASRLDIPGAAGAIRSPTLLIHGSADALVPPSSSMEIHDALDTPREIVILDGADHAFTQAAHQARLVDLTASWILRWSARPGEGG
jgi:pimeloyl-ACP methyl ester carboxylesterase